MEDQIVQLDPSVILAEDNSRYGLRDVESLMQSIVESNGVLQPVEVETLPKKVNGHTHRLTFGFRRYAAVVELNTKQNAGLTLPCIVREVGDSKLRLRRQLTENMERENQSPMDQAVAIKKLFDEGFSRKEIRELYAKPGGKKGNQIIPASNAWVNIIMGLLELPKAIQEKIHDGRVGLAGAYELGKVSPDKRAAVLERAEAERMRQIEQEEKDEEKYLAAEAKVKEVEEKATAVVSEIDETKAAVTAADVLLQEKAAAVKAIQKEPFLELDEKGKKELSEKLSAAKNDVKGVERVKKDAQNKLAKLMGQKETMDEAVKSSRERLSAARKAQKAGKKKAKTVGSEQVKAAAKAEGEDIGLVPLSAANMRQGLKDIIKDSATPEKVRAIITHVQACFNGGPTPKELVYELGVITGEIAAPVTSAAPAKVVKPKAAKAG